MKILIGSTALALLVGCASSSGPVPIGKDTYMIAIGGKSMSSAGTLKADAFKEANQFCINQGKQMQVVSTQQKELVIMGNNSSAEVQFMCLSATDAELQRPKLKPAPTTVIEIKKE
jgi:hypothetical protein